MSEYNGHPDHGHWNAALWIANEEALYKAAIELSRDAFHEYIEEVMPVTPDGVTMSPKLIEYARLAARDENEENAEAYDGTP